MTDRPTAAELKQLAERLRKVHAVYGGPMGMFTGPAERTVAKAIDALEALAAPDEGQSAETLARAFHATYEELAPAFGYATRAESAVPWEQVPEANRALMVAVAARILSLVGVAEEEPRRDYTCPECGALGAHWPTCPLVTTTPKEEPATKPIGLQTAARSKAGAYGDEGPRNEIVPCPICTPTEEPAKP